jgi:hypothetical protein
MKRIVLIALVGVSCFAASTAAPRVQGQDANITTPFPLRMGYTGHLLGTLSTCDGVSGNCNYAWSQTAGTSLTVSGSSASSLTILAPAKGEYTFRLTVQPVEGGATAFADITFGVVVTDNYGRISDLDPKFEKIFGPQERFGADERGIGNPIVGADFIHAALEARFIDRIHNDIGFDNRWLTPATGTVTCSLTTGVCNGAGGAALRTLFCPTDNVNFDNTTTGEGDGPYGTEIVLFVPDGTLGDTHHRNYQGTCTGANQITLSNVDDGDRNDFGTTLTGIQYSKLSAAGLHCSSASNNINYYDRIAGLWSLAERTGLSAYVTEASYEAQNWYLSPCQDMFAVSMAKAGGSARVPAPRARALMGTYWWAYKTGNSLAITRIEMFLDHMKNWLETSYPGVLTDLRERTYEVMWIAMGAILTANPTKQAAYKVKIAAYEDFFHPIGETTPGTSGRWWPATFAGPLTGGSGTYNYRHFTVTPGSSTVTQTDASGWPSTGGNTFAAFTNAGMRLWFRTAEEPYQTLYANGDTHVYSFTVANSTQLTISPAYIGTGGAQTKLAHVFISNQSGGAGPDPAGQGIDVFMTGIALTSLVIQYNALNGDTAYTSQIANLYSDIDDMAKWQMSDGWDMSSNKALHYVLYDASCAAPELSTVREVFCSVNAALDLPFFRYVGMEAAGGLARSYWITGNINVPPLLRTVIPAQHGYFGGNGTDAYYSQELFLNTKTVANGGTQAKPKHGGFCCGMGNISGQLAAAAINGGAPLPTGNSVTFRGGTAFLGGVAIR